MACNDETTLASHSICSRLLRGEGLPFEAGLPLWTPLLAMPVARKTTKQAAKAMAEQGTAHGDAGAT